MRGIFHWIMKIKRVIGRRNQSLMALIFIPFLQTQPHDLLLSYLLLCVHKHINNSIFSEVPMKQKHIYRLIFFFVMAFALGSLVGKIYSHFTSDPRSDQDSTKNSQTSSASMTFQNENWGLGFQEEGKRPTGNASMEELKNTMPGMQPIPMRKKSILPLTQAMTMEICLPF